MAKEKSGYLALCYHYIRQDKIQDKFPRIMGNSIAEFHRHIKMLKKHYLIISLSEAYGFSYKKDILSNKQYGLLLTFDDGLSDHYAAAGILAELKLKAVFFIPTCIITEGLPANPTIIHYCLAGLGITKFLSAYNNALEEYGLETGKFNIKFKKGHDDPWKVINRIKRMFIYRFTSGDSRKILLHIFKHLFLKHYPDALNTMHLKTVQVEDILKMGHSIGVHSHSHISIAASNLTKNDFYQEVIMPKRRLENVFKAKVDAMSYPFGGKKDCLTCGHLISMTNEYKLAFTVEEKVNTHDTSPFELGRYMPLSTDTSARLKSTLDCIIAKQRQ